MGADAEMLCDSLIRVIGDVLRVGRSACFAKSLSDIFIPIPRACPNG